MLPQGGSEVNRCMVVAVELKTLLAWSSVDAWPRCNYCTFTIYSTRYVVPRHRLVSELLRLLPKMVEETFQGVKAKLYWSCTQCKQTNKARWPCLVNLHNRRHALNLATSFTTNHQVIQTSGGRLHLDPRGGVFFFPLTHNVKHQDFFIRWLKSHRTK